MPRRLLATACGAAVALLMSLPAPTVHAQTNEERAAREGLIGSWTLNREMSAPTPSPDVGARRGGRRGGGFGVGGFGGRGGSPGQGAPGGTDPREEAQRMGALLQELLTPSSRLRIARETGDTLAITTADGRTTRYVPNNRREKHQLVNGIIETRTSWNRGALWQELSASDVIALTKTFEVQSEIGQLIVTLEFDQRRQQERPFRVVYDRDGQ